ncbi:MAG: alpha/beta hydrolase-fold protein [Agriterribacter sp.]
MIKFYLSSILFLFAFGCIQSLKKDVYRADIDQFNFKHQIYASSVQDSFFVNVHLPNDYYQRDTTYPVVFVLDANLYFDIYRVLEDKYSEVGLLPKIILVGVGYKDFDTMDSLRNRDYTYPLAIPEYEMATSGGADKFINFFREQLTGIVDSVYHTDKHNRILMGHSLGGYFALYSLYHQLSSHQNLFSGYIAASPSTHYNNNYILTNLEKTESNSKNIKAYISSGGLEDNPADTSAWSTANVFSSLQTSLQKKNAIQLRTEMYSNLDHMDTQIPSFIKGLQWMLFKE